jgi:hypothetical protein
MFQEARGLSLCLARQVVASGGVQSTSFSLDFLYLLC